MRIFTGATRNAVACARMQDFWEALGEVSYGVSEKEAKSLQFRWACISSRIMKAGDVITEKNMRCIRPGMGLAPKYYDVLLGKRVRTDVNRGTAMSWELISNF